MNTKEKIVMALFLGAVGLVVTALIMVFCVVPGGTTAEEVIRDSYMIKTTAQWMLIVAGACGVVCHRIYESEKE